MTSTLNATAASLLGFLHDGPMSGWDLAARAESLIGDFWSLTRSQVYRELSAMADTGLVEPGARGPRQRRPYEITPAGRAAFSAWIAQPPAPESIRFPFLLTVSFGRHLPPARLASFVAEQRAVHAERLTRYEQQHAAASTSPSPDPYTLATLDFGLTYERAVLAWFDRLPDLLEPAGDEADD